MTKLSVNINKVATLRNARGGNVPNLCSVASDIERFGADGITVHPRPDERHIRYQDVLDLKAILTTEFNIEGNPTDSFMALVEQVRPHQVTLVPDAPEALTSNAGWDVGQHFEFLSDIVAQLHAWQIRSSIFVGTELHNIELAARTGTRRIELYTEPYAQAFAAGHRGNAVAPYQEAALLASVLGLEINAGHDLDVHNLGFFAQSLVRLDEVSIGHALISDALYWGLEDTIKRYRQALGS